jgi:glutathione S-transferase
VVAPGSAVTLYQAEWCPFSSAVRERLTELGLPFVAQPVEAWPEEREELQRVAGTDEIPVLVTDDGEVVAGTRAIFRALDGLSSPGERAHRGRFADHADERDAATAELLERGAPLPRD